MEVGAEKLCTIQRKRTPRAIAADYGTTMLLAEQLVGEARERRARRMSARERAVSLLAAASFAAVAVASALTIPNERTTDIPLIVVLVIAYAAVSRVRFEFGGYYVSPEQLVLVPVVLLVPLPVVPALVALAAALSAVPDVIERNWHRDRLVDCLADSWFCMGPVLVLALFAPKNPTLGEAGIYGLAFLAQLGVDGTWNYLRNRLLDRIPFKEFARSFIGIARIDAILSPVALLFAVAAVDHPFAVAAIFPLVWMLAEFARERRGRYESVLELHRAYRGTVTLLSDVVEFDDPYTAEHSRSIMDLVDAVAEEMNIPHDDRQELEFAALLHDVGKIAIPKEILNKPAKLTAEEYELMKTHTIEGQFMLDRVGGMLGRIGEIVRSCHERWDGNGYPDGLAGEDIPLAARIVFCCDAFNAMTTNRVYRPAMPTQEALDELVRNAGTQFDPRIVAVLTKVIQEGEPMVSTSDGIRALLASNANNSASAGSSRRVGAGVV
jgi:HD-GYP domain-containing protein (c-di-GMP phosphodiesterase class II)